MQEKHHHNQEEAGGPFGSSIFDQETATLDPTTVTVASGPHLEKLAVTGRTVAEIREMFADRLDIDPKSTAVIDGKDVGEDTVIGEGTMLTFINRAGEKGNQ